MKLFQRLENERPPSKQFILEKRIIHEATGVNDETCHAC